MKLIIKYSGRKIGFFWEGNDEGSNEGFGISEHKVRAIRESGGPRLNVIAAKVAATLKGHVWPKATTVWVEQEGVRLEACPA